MVTMGDEIRAVVKTKAEDQSFYSELKLLVGQGKLINDGIAFAILKNKLKAMDTATGVLIDGYPRTLAEGEMYDLEGLQQGLMVHIQQDEEVILAKLLGRRVCEGCGANFNVADVTSQGYHLPPQLPKVEGKCDHCGGKLGLRKDDTKRVIKRRMFEFNVKTLPLEAFYRSKGRLLAYSAVKGVAGYPELLEQVKAKLASLG